MKKNQSVGVYAIYFKAIIATCISILMFYPMFGGTMTILNGSFVYFSYFLAIFLLLAYFVGDVFQQMQFKQDKRNISSEEFKKEKLIDYLLFSYTSIIVMIGLLQGRYIVSPILGLLYIMLQLFHLYKMIVEPKYQLIASKMTFMDYVQKILFYLTSITLLLGNQPFESWGIPVATALLLVLNIVNLANIIGKSQMTARR